MPMESMEKQHSKEASFEKFDEYIQRGIERALSRIQEKYEDSPDPKENLPYHNKEHTEQDVIPGTELILRAIHKVNPKLCTERDILLGKFGGAYHDLERDRDLKKDPRKKFTVVTRQNRASRNEERSAAAAVLYMKSVNEKEGEEIFSNEDIKKVDESIMATKVAYDPEHNTVRSTNLTPKSPIIARALVLADLGDAGMRGPEKFLRSGDALFKETYPGLENIFEQMRIPGEIPDEETKFYTSAIRDWSDGQVAFAKDRKKQTRRDLEGFPKDVRSVVRALFPTFDESREAAQQRADKRKKMEFEDLIADVVVL